MSNVRLKSRAKSAFSSSELPFPRIGDEPWQREAILVLMRRTENMAPSLFRLARTVPHAIAYIDQAPILLAARADDLVGAISAGGKLKAVMARLGYAYPLRVLDHSAVKQSFNDVFLALSRLHPSLLAQALPADKANHLVWLRGLFDWDCRMVRVGGDVDRYWPWIVAHAETALVQSLSLLNFADFMGAEDAHFCCDWTLAEAQTAMERWHASLHKSLKYTAAFKRRNKIAFDAPIDYGTLPLRLDVGGSTFVALRSGADLYEEGFRMRHCLASYAGDVAKGRSRIYAVRTADAAPATLELRALPMGKWDFGQLCGFANTAPSAAIIEATHLFLALVNEEALMTAEDRAHG